MTNNNDGFTSFDFAQPITASNVKILHVGTRQAMVGVDVQLILDDGKGASGPIIFDMKIGWELMPISMAVRGSLKTRWGSPAPKDFSGGHSYSSADDALVLLRVVYSKMSV